MRTNPSQPRFRSRKITKPVLFLAPAPRPISRKFVPSVPLLPPRGEIEGSILRASPSPPNRAARGRGAPATPPRPPQESPPTNRLKLKFGADEPHPTTGVPQNNPTFSPLPIPAKFGGYLKVIVHLKSVRPPGDHAAVFFFFFPPGGFLELGPFLFCPVVKSPGVPSSRGPRKRAVNHGPAKRPPPPM